MTDSEQKVIREEFSGFEVLENFAGGCRKSRKMPQYCVHLTPEGKVAKVEEYCPQAHGCGGYRYRYSIV